ncbi:MAG: phosphomannose isomerase type II C-terminal cupin domain [Candidatus Hodarchaeales archaeon]|jgi:mannose-6-phosphate isomerase-like protein (cupin superfamily)
MNYKESRPWGTFENLIDRDYCKVKEIIIKPDQAPSYQYHFKRSEVWVLTKGIGRLTLDDKDSDVKVGDIIHVPTEVKHQIRNCGDEDLHFIEIQLGEYFGEDDIVRLRDDYGR